MSGNRYLLFQKAEAALLEEKGDKLFGITRILDNHLRGSYHDLLKNKLGENNIEHLSRKEKLVYLNQELEEFTDSIAGAFPGVGVGYYSLELDAILTYGPSKKYPHTIGVSVSSDHIGRKAMREEREIIGVGSMVRGEIMNCVRPLVREGKSIGFTWANETVEDIYRQIGQGAQQIFFSSDIQPALGLTGLILFCSRGIVRDDDHLSWTVLQIYKYLKTFLNSLNIGIIIADARDNIVFTNSGLADILKMDLEQLNYRYYEDYHLFLDRIGFKEISNRCRKLINENKDQYISQSNLELPGGEIKDINYLIALLRDEGKAGEGNGIHGTVVLMEDLKSVKEEEEKMERAGKLATLGEISASIAHEIRNPLSIVQGSLQLLPQRIGDREFIYSFIRIASEELDRVNNSVEALLDFARFSQPEFGLVNINEVIKEIIEFFSATIENKKIKVKQDLVQLPYIEADRKQVKQALLNLVLNAVQAMSFGGQLSVSTWYREGDKFVKISISDTGTGISDKHKPYVFDAFYSTKKKGTGLGLSLVHRMIDEHQGIIEFNTKERQGTVFYLHLPVKQFNSVPGGTHP